MNRCFPVTINSLINTLSGEVQTNTTNITTISGDVIDNTTLINGVSGRLDTHTGDTSIHFTDSSVLHNNRTDLQGGTSGEYYHLTESQYLAFTADTNDTFVTAGTLNTLTLSLERNDGQQVDVDLSGLDTRYVNVTGDTINGNITINGDLTVTGTTTIEYDHNDLNNIQGGQAGEYYHLTQNEYSDPTGGS